MSQEEKATADGIATSAKVDPPLDPRNSTKTNGVLVRFVGRNRIQDGLLHALEWFLFPPIGVYNLCVARLARTSWNDTFYDLFCLGNRPKGSGEVLTVIVSSPRVKLKVSSRFAHGYDSATHLVGCHNARRQEGGNEHERAVTVVAISDTHMCHRDLKLPEGDILVHTGDFTNAGSIEEVEELWVF